MIRRTTLIGALAVTTSTLVTTAPLVVAHTALSFTNPTTTTTTSAELATPTTTTTTPELAAPTTTTTTTTTLPDHATRTTTTTTSPELATPTTTAATTTTSPELATPITSTTTTPELATPSTSTSTVPELATPTTTVPDADVPLGEIDTSGAVPDGLDLSVVPGAEEGADDGGSDGPVLTDSLTCVNQCIKSGLAYPRGFGAELVVKTYVEARLFISVVDSNNEHVDTVNTNLVTNYSWPLDHLDPGETYYVVLAATDENHDTAHAFGEFETLSRRSLTVAVGNPFFTAGPTNFSYSATYVWVNDFDTQYVNPQTPVWYYSVPRQLELAVTVFFRWTVSQYTLCEYWHPYSNTTQGDSDINCGTWNTAATQVDLDAIPDGRSRWTTVEISRTLDTSTDGVVAPDYDDPRYLGFQVIVTLTVEYS